MAQDWNEYADRLRTQLPAAPESLTPVFNGYVAWMPWISIIFGAIGLCVGLGFLLAGALLSPFLVYTGYAGAGLQLFISIVALLLGSALGVAGGYLMLQRSLTGWWLLAVGYILNALGSLVGGHIFNLIIILAFAYVHLNVKPRYS